MKTIIALFTAAMLTACATPQVQQIHQNALPKNAHVDVHTAMYQKMLANYCPSGKSRYFGVTEHYASITCSGGQYFTVQIKDW